MSNKKVSKTAIGAKKTKMSDIEETEYADIIRGVSFYSVLKHHIGPELAYQIIGSCLACENVPTDQLKPGLLAETLTENARLKRESAMYLNEIERNGICMNELDAKNAQIQKDYNLLHQESVASLQIANTEIERLKSALTEAGIPIEAFFISGEVNRAEISDSLRAGFRGARKAIHDALNIKHEEETEARKCQK